MWNLLKLFKSLSDETRLRVIGVLLVRECCVCEVMQALEISQTRASRNLSILFNAGLLKQRREGQWALYRIDREGMNRQAPGLLTAVARMLEKNRTVATDRRRLESSVRVGPGCAEDLDRSVRTSARSRRLHRKRKG